MSQESVRQAAPRSALDAQALLRNECADRGRRLEGLAVIVMTALGECAAAGRRAAGRRGATGDDRDDGLSVSPAAASSGCSSSLSGLRSGSNRDVTDRSRASQPTARQQSLSTAHVRSVDPDRESDAAGPARHRAGHLEHPGRLLHAPGEWTPPLVISRQGIRGRRLAYICVCCRGGRRTGCSRRGRAAACHELSVHP
jgi:hypothetical protein